MGPCSLGCKRDPPHRRTQKSSRLALGDAPTFPPSASFEHLEGSILDQNSTEGCTGHGTSQALTVACAKQGKPLPFRPSPGGIWTITRAVERAQSIATEFVGTIPVPPLKNEGTMPADVMLALSRYGVWPLVLPSPQGFATDVDPSNMLDDVDLENIVAGSQQIVTGEYRVDEAAPDLFAQVCAGINAYGAVGIGIFVDTAFMRWDPSTGPVSSIDTSDPNGGGHWLALTSYDTAGGGMLRGPNSWSSSWGSSGHFELTPQALASAVSDCYLFSLAGA